MKFFKPAICLLLLCLIPLSARALNDVYVVHLVLDGLRYDVLNRQLNEGNIPNLKGHFYEKGAIFEKAITTFPTVSSPGYVSFATGLRAGNSGVFFLEWFDRIKQKPVGYLTPKGHERVNSDLINKIALRNVSQSQLYTPQTLFEKLKPHPTASIYTPLRRGASIVRPKKFPLKGLWNGLVTQNGLALNKLAMEELVDLFSKPPAEIPRYTLVALYGPDYHGHHDGPDSEELHWDLKQFDLYFKGFLDQLEKNGLKEKTYIVLSSDHGMHTTGRLLKLRDALWEKGIRKKDKIYVSNRGVSSTFVYVSGEKGWEELPTIDRLRNFPVKEEGGVDLVEALLDEKAVDWVAARDGLDRVRIYNDKGESLIVQNSIQGKTFYSYTTRGADPLGYDKNLQLKKLLNAKPYTESVWFQATVDEARPNAVVDLSALFKDPRAGDILVVAKEPWSFRKAKAGTHGSLDQGDMHIPLWITGPDVPKAHFGAAKSMDLYPTVLRWFGLDEAEDLKDQEGNFLFEVQKENQDPLSAHLANLERELMKRPRLSKLIDREKTISALKKTYPKAKEKELLRLCEEEIRLRHQKWLKLQGFQESVDAPNNPLQVDKASQKNMKWLFSKEVNLEFQRLRRMEDIKSILEERPD